MRWSSLALVFVFFSGRIYMSISPWIQPNVALPDTGQITSFLFARKSWQIFQDDKGTRILITTPELMDTWVRRKFVDRSFVHTMKIEGGVPYNYLLSPARYTLAPIKNGDIAHDYSTAYSLAMAMSASRELDLVSDFNLGIFSSLFRKILPVPRAHEAGGQPVLDGASLEGVSMRPLKAGDDSVGTEAEVEVEVEVAPEVEALAERVREVSKKDDETLFVNWLTKGASKKLGSGVKLTQLVKWLSPEQLTRILRTAGIAPDGRPRASRKELPEQPKDDDMKRFQDSAFSKLKAKTPLPKRKERDTSRPEQFSLPGRRALESFLNEHIVDVLNEADKYKKLGIDNPSGVLLHGPPGCGKTYAVDQLVKFLDIPSFFINSSTVASPYIHDSAKKISAIFDRAIASAPSLLVVDEMEAYMSQRSSSASQQHQVEEVAEFLRRIPEAIDKKVVIIAMTNLLEFIDTALLRQGRFDHKIILDLPDRIDVRAALKSILEKRPTEDDLDIEPVLDFLVRRPLSDCNYVVREASRLAVRRGMDKLSLSTLIDAAKLLPPAKMKPDIGF
jgi:adenylate kinase family enzyme